MNIQKIPFHQTNAFKDLFLDYIDKKKELTPFYGNFPDLAGFKNQIGKKQFPKDKREILVSVLKKQYSHLTTNETVKANIEALEDENTYTITTGHQLNIFTGPLYFIYKIITVVNLCEKLSSEFPDKKFVPVYWMATEDHDFDEICYFNLFGKKYQWESNQTGAVGKFSPNGIQQILEELPEKVEVFERAYRENETLSGATRQYVNEIFGQYGLVALDGDDPKLKKQFTDVIVDDLHNHQANELAGKAAEKLNQMGYQSQVYPRSINFFYQENGIRERIVKESDQFRVNETDIQFSPTEIHNLIDDHPEKFSPNVVLRPLFQEMILPNLAYIGGPAEIAYWLQLKDIFIHYKVPFPILVPRNFALVIPKNIQQKVDKLGMKPEELFMDFHELKLSYLARNSDSEISIQAEMDTIQQTFESIQSKASNVDKSLEGFIAAESAKTQKSLDNIAKRIRKSEEKKQETEINQLENVIGKLFPNDNLQERHDNFLNFYINNPNFIDEVKSAFDPLDFTFFILSYHE